MDISYLGKEKYKIKLKTGSVNLSPTGLVIAHKTGGEEFVVNMPGEYEVGGISVFGYTTEAENIYVVHNEDISVLYLGNISKGLSEKNIADLENIDCVIVGVDHLPTKDLSEILSKLEPYYILPYGELVEKFVNAYEHGKRSVKSLPLSKSTLPDDLTEVIVFE